MEERPPCMRALVKIKKGEDVTVYNKCQLLLEGVDFSATFRPRCPQLLIRGDGGPSGRGWLLMDGFSA